MFEVSDDYAAKYQKYLLRIMESFERKMRSQWFDLLQKTYSKAATSFEHGQDMTAVITQHRNDINKQLLINYKNLLAWFGTFTFDQFKKKYEKSLAIPSVKSMEDVYWQDSQKWMIASALSKSRGISKTTEKLIHSSISRGMRDGLSNVEITKQIGEGSKSLNKVRATRIVRTETHGSANRAINSAVNSTGFKHNRIWRSTIDDRIRGRNLKDRFNHLKVNKQLRPMDQPFDVSREKLDFPGDPKGSAGNIVNCRCVVTYHTSRVPVSAKPQIEQVRPLGGFVPGKRSSDREWHNYMSSWENGSDLKDVKIQLKNKFRVNQVIIDQSITKNNKEKIEIINAYGQEMARINKESPRLSKYVRRRRPLSKITLTNKEGLNKWYEKLARQKPTGNYSGFYETSTRHMVIDQNYVKKRKPHNGLSLGEWHSTHDIMSTFRHEYGHHLHGFSKSKAWDNLYREVDEDIKELISHYGYTNSKEFFAETFTLYTHPNFKTDSFLKLIDNRYPVYDEIDRVIRDDIKEKFLKIDKFMKKSMEKL